MTAPVETRPEADEASELDQPLWAVISFENVEGTALTYSEARELLAELDSRGVHGLALITAEAAERLAR
jgi:hypothetical protein